MNTTAILGAHPQNDLFGSYVKSTESSTHSQVPHRILIQEQLLEPFSIGQVRTALRKHHISPEEFSRRQRKLLEDIGYKMPPICPKSDTTRKGNFAEVFLAEYTVASSGYNLPVYRLRYNPNIEQSMKGDDVLVFDFNSDPIRILVGEAKFRSVSSKKSVDDIIKALMRSHNVGVPISLQFVATRLFAENNTELGDKVEECACLIANGQLFPYYIGLLVSDNKVNSHVNTHASHLKNLVFLSLGLNNPNNFVNACFENL